FRLFSAAPKNERIASLETHYCQPAPRSLDEHLANLLLRVGVNSFLLPNVQPLGRCRRDVEQRLASQVIVQHTIRLFEDAPALAGNEITIAGTCSDQVHLAHVVALNISPAPNS